MSRATYWEASEILLTVGTVIASRDTPYLSYKVNVGSLNFKVSAFTAMLSIIDGFACVEFIIRANLHHHLDYYDLPLFKSMYRQLTVVVAR